MWRYRHWRKRSIPGNTGEWRYSVNKPTRDPSHAELQEVVVSGIVHAGYRSRDTLHKHPIMLSLEEFNGLTPSRKEYWKDAEPVYSIVWLKKV